MHHRSIAALALCALLITACGQPQTSPTPAPSAESPTAPPTAQPTSAAPERSPTPLRPTDAATQTVAPTATTAATKAPEAPTATTAATEAPTTPPEPSPTLATTATPEPSATPARDVETSTLKLAVVANGFTKPLYLVSAKDDTGRLFVVEQAGVVKILRNGAVAETPFLDITSRVDSQDNERGLLSIAFHPQFRNNGLLYVDYTDLDGNTIVARYTATGDQADPASEQILLKVDQPYPNHNGGQLQFGPDGYLYISLGDGGSGGDPGNRAQNTESLLGKLLRIDVNSGEPYGIPSDNPFASGGGKPEIWALGLRNPWRFSFDRQTGDLWIGDVGQGSREEIDFQPAGTGGVNYGWKQVEGNKCYVDGCDLTAFTPPVQDYDHDQGCSVSGGYVYHGAALPQLQGWYLYGDYCSGNIWMLRREGPSWQNRMLIANSGAKITSFGEDQQGEVYVIDRDGQILRFAAK